MDPLSLLKDFLVSGRLESIKREADRINFGDSYVFPKSASTGFKSAARKDYSLEVVLNLVLNRHLPHTEYLKSASEKKIGVVNMTDRKKLLDFLDGKGELQLEVPDGTFAVPSARELHDEPAAKRARLEEEEGEIAGLSSLVKQERQLRDRNTMMIVPNKSFSKFIEIAHKAMAAYRSTNGTTPAVALAAPQQPPSSSKPRQPDHGKPSSSHRPSQGRSAGGAIPVKPSGRFDRNVTDEQLRAMGDEAANLPNVISMYGAYDKSTGQPSAGKDKPPPPPSATGQQQHRATHNGDVDPVSSTKPHPSSGGRPPSSGSKPDKPPPPHGSSGGGRAAPGASASGKLASTLPAPAAEKAGGIPIIIVPSGMTAIMNLYNVKQFLEAGRFERSDEAQKRVAGMKQSLLVVNRSLGRAPGAAVPYHVMDKAPEKGHKDWARVVAVIVQGAKWQFKDWPFNGVANGDMSELFAKICGFYLHFSNEKVPDVVANWNVRRLGLHPDNRHLDMTVLLELYRSLDAFLLSRKSTLSY